RHRRRRPPARAPAAAGPVARGGGQRAIHRQRRGRAAVPRGDGRLRAAVARRGHVERADGGHGGRAARGGDGGRRQHRGGDRRADGRADPACRRGRDRPRDRSVAARSRSRCGTRCGGARLRHPALRRARPRGRARAALRGAPRAPGEEGGVSQGNGSARRRVLVVGLDAATFDLVLPWAESGVLPTIGRLIRQRVRAPLRSTLPPPGRPSAATGRNPGKHSVFNFYRGRAGGLEPAPVTPGDLRSPRVWDIAAQKGLRSVVLHMPLTYPPEDRVGVMISGIMTPKGAEDFVAPAALKDTLAGRIAGYRMEVDASPLKRGDLETFRRDAFDLQRVQTEEALYLMQHEDWDLFWVMTHTLDKLQHFFWRFMDADHPAHPGAGTFQHVIRDFHVAFDESLARLI